jgi:hypothetical protein
MEREMKLFLLLSLQAAAPPAPAPAPADPTSRAVDFDLAKVKRADGPGGLEALFACDRAQGSEIVVCGRRKGYAYPLDAMAKIYEAKPLRAETRLGNGATANVHVEDAEMANGMISHRVMVGIKLPF